MLPYFSAPLLCFPSPHPNWLVMGEPVNRAMLLGDQAASMSPAEIRQHLEAALDTFLPNVLA